MAITMISTRLESWLPRPTTASRREQLRACLGALVGMLMTGLISHYALAHDAASIYLVAPIGASSVLVFALPASPLAQPWSVIGGNVVSGLAGAACVHWFGDGIAVAALAACMAIGAMFALRCLHPPGGAVALTTVIGGPAVHAAGFGFALGPVLFNSALLVASGVIYNNLTRRRYPHLPQAAHPHATLDARPTARLGFTAEDLDAVLRQYNQVLDVSRNDLEALFLQTEMRAYGRRFGIISCADIMSKDVITAEFGTELSLAWRDMHSHKVAALPVLSRARRVIGIVTQSDFLEHGQVHDYHGMRHQLLRFVRRSGRSHGEKAEVVGQIMTSHPATAQLDTPIADLVPLMADSGFHHIPVLDAEQRLVGIVTQSDLVAALYESRLVAGPAGPV